MIAGNLSIGWLAYAIATLSPGPAVFGIMNVAMVSGRLAALHFSFGVICGSFFWALSAVFGLTSLLLAYPRFLVAVKLIGGGYLLWLAWKAARSALATKPVNTGASMHADKRSCFLRGLFLHLTNPKAIVAWAAIATLAMPAGASFGFAGSLVAGCAVLGVSIFCGYALLFSTARARDLYAAGRRYIESAVAAVFGAAAIKLLLSARSAA